jgi:hypothetical protein
MAWEQSKDFTTGYLTEWQDVERWRLKIVQCGVGGTRWQWEVTKRRDTQGPRGEWYDSVAFSSEGTRRGARLMGGLVLRLAVTTKAKAGKLARQARAHGYYGDPDGSLRLRCPQCPEWVTARTQSRYVKARPGKPWSREIDGVRMVWAEESRMEALDRATVDHLIHACEWMPSPELVDKLLHGRRGGES